MSATCWPATRPNALAHTSSTNHGSVNASSASVALSAASPSAATSWFQRSGCASKAGSRNGEIVNVRSGAASLWENRPSAAIVAVRLAGPTSSRSVRPACAASLSRAQPSRSSTRLITSAARVMPLQHVTSVHFGQRDILAGHVAQTESDADAVELLCRKGQCLGVALDRRHEAAFIEHAVAAGNEHGRVDVREEDAARRPDAIGEKTREIGGAPPAIQHNAAP